jgi:hypothetical protein
MKGKRRKDVLCKIMLKYLNIMTYWMLKIFVNDFISDIVSEIIQVKKEEQ